MEKRQVYIITILIILALLTGLSVWYAYIVRQEVQLTQTQTIDPTELSVPPQITTTTSTDPNALDVYGNKYGSAGTTDGAATPIDNAGQTEANTIIRPANWMLSNLSQEPILNFNIKNTSVIYTDAKLGTISMSNSATGETDMLSQETLPDIASVYTLTDTYTLIIPKLDRPYIIDILGEDVGITIYDTILQVAQTGDAVYYMSPSDIGISIKKIRYKDLTKDPLPITELWSSPLSGWILQSYNNGIYITQKASNSVPGYAYKLSNGGVLAKLVGDKPALITNLSPDGETLLYSTIQGADITLNIKDLSSGNVTPLYTTTLASKCAWANDSINLYCAVPNNLAFTKGLPDSWYKGTAHLSDNLWRIDTQTGEAVELVPYLGLDMVEIQPLGDNGVVFKDKTEQTLWSIIREEPTQ